MPTSSEKVIDTKTSNGMKDTVCLVDIPMPSADESHNGKTTSKEGPVTSNANITEQTPDEEKINSSDKTRTDFHRQFNLISVPPPPPPSEPKITLASNIVIATHRTVKFDSH